MWNSLRVCPSLVMFQNLSMAWRQNDTDSGLSSSLQMEENWGTSWSAQGQGAFELGLESNKDTSGMVALPAAMCAGDWHAEGRF